MMKNSAEDHDPIYIARLIMIAVVLYKRFTFSAI
jgi:hypothetical protein